MADKQTVAIYSFRIRPSGKTKERLSIEWDCARFIWNKCVEAGEASHKASKAGIEHIAPTFCRMAKNLTALRFEYEWLRVGSQVVQQQAVRKWAKSYQQAFKQPALGWPKFKSGKTSNPSLEYTTNGFCIKGGRLCLAGGITIPVVWSRSLPSEPKSCTVTRDGAGHWSVHFVTRRASESFCESDKSIGIDWGVANVATTTDPAFDLSCGNQTSRTAASLSRAGRKLSRAVKGSNKRKRAKTRLAKIHIRIARQRKDRAFKWARRVVSAFGHIAIEDFKPNFLAKSTMAKKSADGAVGLTKRILISMAESAGRHVALVHPAYTTMDCEKCAARNKQRLPLSQRVFVCDSCGHTADRDRNASGVIRSRAGFNPTNVDGVRLLHGPGCVVAA